jgi:hypothetical protein
MVHFNINITKKLCQQKKAVCLFTRHYDGDKYHGIISACSKDLILLESDNDFVFDGIVALPTRQLKFLRRGGFEKTLDQIYLKFKLLKFKRRSSWLLKVENIQQLIGECYKRTLWPIIETQSKNTNALFIGPITSPRVKILGVNFHGRLNQAA